MISIWDLSDLDNRIQKKSQLQQLRDMGLVDALGEEITPEKPIFNEGPTFKEAIKQAVKCGPSIRRAQWHSQTPEQIAKGKKYYKLACNFLAKEGNKRFALESIYPIILREYAVHCRKNFIGLLTPDRKSRYRARMKTARSKDEAGTPYTLKSHTEKRGYRKQSWFIGNPTTEAEDYREALRSGGDKFYFPPEVYHMAFEILRELHWVFTYYFDRKPNKKKARGRLAVFSEKVLNKCRPYGIYSYRPIFLWLQGIFKMGTVAYAKGLGFGRKRGRPKKYNDSRLGAEFARTKDGQEMVNKYMKSISKDAGIVLRDRRTAKKIKAITMRYICTHANKNTTTTEIKMREEAGERLRPQEILEMALKDMSPLIAIHFKEVPESARWGRGQRKPSFAQYKNNSPRYSLLNKYNVTKERITGRRGCLNL